MVVFVNLLILIFLGFIVIQDFKDRAISWFLLPLLFISLALKSSMVSNFSEVVQSFIMNLIFVLLQLVLLTIWVSLRNKKLTNIIDTYIGLGDVLFFVAITTAFSSIQYILFYAISICLTLFGFLLYRYFFTKTNPQIPLAGAMAVFMMSFMLISNLLPGIGFYHSELLYLFTDL
jgi:hypothetical protein